jgi:acyl-CoA synthetase (AMP-forming)/AMP-acid ligase II
LAYPPGLEFVAALWGCFYAGVVATPLPLPRPGQPAAAMVRVARDAGASALLTVAARVDDLESEVGRDGGVGTLRFVATDVIGDQLAAAWQPTGGDRDDVALLQYTSGSTGTPRGVMVSHGNLLHNCEAIRRSFELGPESVSVSWLPAFHDMGLVDGIIQPVYGGFPAVMMPPAAFLQSPVRWLQGMTKFGGTHSGGPNFGYDLCVRRVTAEQMVGLDLRRWASAYNGAEPVRSETLRRFTEHFTPAGFRARQFYPCYGMAEATLIISGGRIEDEPVTFLADSDALGRHHVVEARAGSERARAIVGCGRPWLGTRVEIVEPESRRRCQSETVGEIWVAGPSVARGYWRQAKATGETFGAQIEGGDGTRFLRTGDMGFIHEGELFVTGRIKDMIIIRGQNFYPQDIEGAAEACHPGLRADGGAAFTVGDGDERLVVVQEVERVHLRSFDAVQATKAVRMAVADEFGLQVHEVVFIRPGTLPRTSSGKVQRGLCRARFLEGKLSLVVAARVGDEVSNSEPGTAEAVV